MYSDGGAHIWEQLRLSGEAPIKELADQLGTGPTAPMSLPEYQALGLRKIEYCQRYREYWNSTIDQTGTGRPADAFIMPVAPHAAVIPGKYYYYGRTNSFLPPFAVLRMLLKCLDSSIGYSEIINLLDYTSIVIPVTKADRSLDKFEKYYTPLNKTDKMNWEACKQEEQTLPPCLSRQTVQKQILIFRKHDCLHLQLQSRG